MSRTLPVVRIALFAALVYVLSWGTSYLPNVNFIFFIVFSSGFLWGIGSGMLVGAVGMGLWTLLNPYGPAALPVMIAQVIGAAGSGLVGGLFRRGNWHLKGPRARATALVLAATACTVVFYLPVNTVDAWVFGPFVARFIGGLIWALISLAANVAIFPLLFGATRYLYDRGWAFQ